MAGDDWMTLTEAAALLGLPVRTLDRWAKAGRLRSTVSEDGKILLLRQQIEEIAGWKEGKA